MKGFLGYLNNRLKKSIAMDIIWIVYAIFCLGSVIYFACISQTRNVLMCIGYLLFIPLVWIVEYLFKIRIVPLLGVMLYALMAGGVLGAGYDLYTIFPLFDMILHCMSGVIFACVGFGLMKLFFNKEDKKSFFACLLFGVFFSIAIAGIWEIFEFTSTRLLGYDMQEDGLVYGFNSYFLSGSHNVAYEVNEITKTIIYYGNNEILVIDGYLDLGLIDTMADMIICLVGALFFMVLSIFSYYKVPVINEWLIPLKVDKRLNKPAK